MRKFDTRFNFIKYDYNFYINYTSTNGIISSPLKPDMLNTWYKLHIDKINKTIKKQKGQIDETNNIIFFYNKQSAQKFIDEILIPHEIAFSLGRNQC